MTVINYRNKFTELSNSLDVFIGEVKKKKMSLMATDEWTVKDVLCHIVFWHESYAANYKALAANLDPPLLEGPGYALNIEGVSMLRNISAAKLIERLRKAQNTLYESIVKKGVPKMTYKQGGRVYSTPEFLHLIAGHLLTHATQVRRAK